MVKSKTEASEKQDQMEVKNGSESITECSALLKDTKYITICGIKQDTLVLICILFIRFGDGIEVYLPGVVTQQISCDLDISRSMEAILAVSMYLCQALATVCSYFSAEHFGRKPVLLVSLYLSIVVTILCAIVPNYWVLLVSRCLIGFCIGLNGSTMGVYFSEVLQDKNKARFGTYLQMVAISAGAGWISFLGYLCLEKVGWRVFILMTSIPVFIPPICMLHCCLPESSVTKHSSRVEPGKLGRRQVIFLTVKFVVIGFISIFQGTGIVMLFPELISSSKKQNPNMSESGCDTIISGKEFLLMTIVTGGCNLFGRVSSLGIVRRVGFRAPLLVTSVLTCLMYGGMLIWEHLTPLYVVALGVVQVVTGFETLKRFGVQFDPKVFGSYMAFSSMIIIASQWIGSTIGNALAVLFDPKITITAGLVLSVIKGITVLSVNEIEF